MRGEHRIRGSEDGVVVPCRDAVPREGKIVAESRLLDRDATRWVTAKERNQVTPDRGRCLIPWEREGAGEGTAEAPTTPRGRPAGSSGVIHRSGMYHPTLPRTPYHRLSE